MLLLNHGARLLLFFLFFLFFFFFFFDDNINVSASAALQSIQQRGTRAVSTGLTQLNRILAPQGLPGHNVVGGLMRGKITEVYGPSGVGKTAFG